MLCAVCVRVCFPFVQKDFVRLIQSSGVLVVLSQAWIEELYHQVLERNLLAEAGYWGSPEDHTLPLITTLTGTRNLVSCKCKLILVGLESLTNFM